MGNKLNIPRFIVISAIIGSKFSRFCFAAEPIAAVMPTGPETALIPYFPLIRSISDRHTTAQYDAAVAKVCLIYEPKVFLMP